MQKGNALFLILIAVALFAALSYAVTRSGGGGGGSADREKAALAASQLLQAGADLQSGINRIRLMNGCNLDAIDGDTFSGPPATYPGPCNVWDVNGGAVKHTPSPGWPWYPMPINAGVAFSSAASLPAPGNNALFVNSMDVRGTASGRYDLSFIVFNITREACNAINRQVGITTTDGEAPLEDSPYSGGWINPISTGILNPGGWSQAIGESQTSAPAPNELNGHRAGCYRATEPAASMGYHFYYVLEEH